jgi:ribosomal protein S18 acetylase RimI-like enzyme
MERSDFPLIRDWIDTRLFRIFRDPIGDDQMEALLCREEGGNPVDLGYVAVEMTAQEPVGFIHAVLDWRNELAHIQQVVSDPGHRREGVGAALMHHVMKICFDHHGLHRVQLFVDEDNEPALEFYRKLGFTSDGLMREATKRENGFVSWHCMSMLTTEWGGEHVEDDG